MIDFLPLSAILVAIDAEIPDNHLFHFRLDQPLPVSPGQFVEVTVRGIGSFPVSAATWPTQEYLSLTIRRVGRVTAALYRLTIGDVVGIRGPFGRGFPLDKFVRRDVLLLAGGLGMIPLRTLLHWLLAHREMIGEVSLLYGSYDPGRFLFRSELEMLAASGALRLTLTVDRPESDLGDEASSACRLGFVGDLLKDHQYNPQKTVAAVCGPPAIYRHLLERLAESGISAASIFASLERRMRCGVGQCCHCIAGGVYVCSQGPVFSLEELRTMPGAI